MTGTKADRRRTVLGFLRAHDADSTPHIFGDLRALRFRDRFTGSLSSPSAEYVSLFVDLTYANEVELACASSGGPTQWSWLADFCRETGRWASPKFAAGAMALLQPTT